MPSHSQGSFFLSSTCFVPCHTAPSEGSTWCSMQARLAERHCRSRPAPVRHPSLHRRRGGGVRHLRLGRLERRMRCLAAGGRQRMLRLRASHSCRHCCQNVRASSAGCAAQCGWLRCEAAPARCSPLHQSAGRGAWPADCPKALTRLCLGSCARLRSRDVGRVRSPGPS